MLRSGYLLPALIAVLVIAALLAGGTRYAESLESRYVHALAPVAFNQKYLGDALQRAAFRQPDLLPIYGSSELALQEQYQDPYRAINLFRGQPTGFNIFPIGQGDTTDLLIAQRLASIGPDLRGKKVVISLSPTWFFERKQLPHRPYAGNFSRLHANMLIFSTELSYDLKRAVATRMLDYPATLDRDPLLRFATQQLVGTSPINWALYYLAIPLGKLQSLVLALQDHWEVLSYIWSHPGIHPDVAQRATPPDWPALLADGERASQEHTNNNPFGFDNLDWQTRYQKETSARQHTLDDRTFLRHMQHAREWIDFTLLLRTLHELGARPLILSMPIGGSYYDYLGVSAQARGVYYAKLRLLAQRYGVAERDFADHDQDPYFVLNARGHLLPKGWVYYSQALDSFYHDQPIQ